MLKFRTYLQNSKGRYIQVTVFSTRQEMIDTTRNDDYTITPPALGIYLAQDNKKLLGKVYLLAKEISIDTLSHEIQHALLHYSAAARIFPFDTGSAENEDICDAAGKLSNDTLYKLLAAGYDVTMTKPNSHKSFRLTYEPQ